MYRNLEAEMARRGITRKEIARCLNVRDATVSDKLRGKYKLSLNEAFKIKDNFFPGQSIEYLFDTDMKDSN